MKNVRRSHNLTESGNARIVVCPFCDHEIMSREMMRMKTANEPPSVRVVKCRNCGEAFETEPDEEDFIFGPNSGF